jgi:alkylation response protein AidB-like acyl-CoA dehydrogenase
MVPDDTDGLGGEPLTLVSEHPIGRLVFEDAYVPAEYVLGDVDRGFSVAMQTLDRFRPSVGAFATSVPRGSTRARPRSSARSSPGSCSRPPPRRSRVARDRPQRP